MHESLREEIQRKFVGACARNPNYSMRSLARQLGINHSAVSELLSGKRKLSPKRATDLAMRLGLSLNKIQSIQTEASGTPSYEGHSQKERGALSIQLDQFELISGWMPFAMLSLMETDDFHYDIGRMARRLQAKKSEVKNAIERLARLGMIEADGDKGYRTTGQSYATPEFVANDAMKFHHLQNLEKARQALETPIRDRYFASMTMAIDPEKMAEAKIALAKFRDEFCVKLEASPKREVYRLVLQFFPLSRRL